VSHTTFACPQPLSLVHVEIITESELVVVYFRVPDSFGPFRVFTRVASKEQGSVGFDPCNDCVFEGLGSYIDVYFVSRDRRYDLGRTLNRSATDDVPKPFNSVQTLVLVSWIIDQTERILRVHILPLAELVIVLFGCSLPSIVLVVFIVVFPDKGFRWPGWGSKGDRDGIEDFLHIFRLELLYLGWLGSKVQRVLAELGGKDLAQPCGCHGRV